MCIRDSIRSVEEFQARVHAKDPTALKVEALLASQGRRVTASNELHGIRCVAAMMAHAEKHYDTLLRVWPLVCRIAGESPIQTRLLVTLIYLESKMVGESLTDPFWSSKLMKLGNEGILKAIQAACDFHAQGGERVWSIGLEGKLQGRRRLPIGEQDAGDVAAQ